MDSGTATLIAGVLTAIGTVIAAIITKDVRSGVRKAVMIVFTIVFAALIIAGILTIPLKKDNTVLQQENADLKQQNEALVEESQEGVSAAESQVSGLQEQIKELNTQITGLREENEQLEINHKAEVAKLNETINSLNSQIDTLQDQLHEVSDTSEVVVDTPNSDYSGKPDVWLCDLDYFDISATWEFGGSTKDNFGNDHSHSMNLTGGPTSWGSYGGYIIYNLDKKYSHIDLWFYQEYYARAQGAVSTLAIYCDDEILENSVVAGRGIDPVHCSYDIRGTSKLKIELSGEWARDTALGEVGLWK